LRWSEELWRLPLFLFFVWIHLYLPGQVTTFFWATSDQYEQSVPNVRTP
jgi:hypothetical protein